MGFFLYLTLVYIIIKSRVIKVIDVHVNGYLNQLYKYIFLVFCVFFLGLLLLFFGVFFVLKQQAIVNS